MKILKKKSFFTLFLAITLIITACSKGDNKTEIKKLSGQDIAQKSIDSLKISTSFETITEGSGYSALKDISVVSSTNYTIEASLIKDPLSYKLVDRSGELTSLYYFVNGSEYSKKYQNNTSTPWERKNDSIKTVSYFYNTFHLNNIVNYNKDYILTETDSTYIIDFRPENFEEFKNTYYAASPPNVRDQSTIDFYSLRITIDKSTFLPLEEEVEYRKIEFLEESQVHTKSYYKEKRQFKNYNNIENFELPEGLKNIIV
ncbi:MULTISPECIES: DUF6612 family protein [unclassified Gemella]|uniref:DUF6612 family protein n=1 Tax=unclassified Gemella TaxID=2624949 RepID=UPI0010745373|nr:MULTISPECIES: DUF6612 family protein [unclassified Gemella]MBF0710503.1 hypothetical protein [Gemella sp. GL1.1]MBF0746556.1 hypothetical protein [Gemella sp. 19428wG2_WT2a]NYS27847.1 hypothetical protein [Gemella sp. GL1]TFU59916.1 hypothetical protein E4T67_02700 [Gemella sp. WT2a]